jgi:peptide/nickel transport system substrate-binding protein
VRKAIIMVSLLVFISLIGLTFSCSGNKTTTTAPPKTTTSPPKTTVTTPPTPTAQYGGDFKILFNDTPKNLGWPGAPASGSSLHMPSCCVEGLIALSRDGSGNLAPWLATSWEYNADHTMLTFHLRQGVKFQDETPFNADAVKYVFDLEKANNISDLDTVTSVTVVDDFTVQLSLSSYDVKLLASFYQDGVTRMFSPTYLKSATSDEAMMHPVSTGPYKFDSYNPNVSLKFVRFDDYWGGKPYLDSVTYVINMDPVTTVMSYKSGEAQAIWNLTPKDAGDLAKDSNNTILNGPGASVGVIGMIMDSAHTDTPYATLEVREAINHALNRQILSDTTGLGYYDPATQWVPMGTMAYDESANQYTTYDVNLAKQLMQQAGYENGFTTTITFLNMNPYNDLYTLVQSQLAEIGITVKLDAADPGRLFQTLAGGWQNAMLWDGLQMAVGMDAGSAFYSWFSDKAMAVNAASVSYPADYLSTLTAANAEPDATKRLALLKQCEVLLNKYAIGFPLISLKLLAVYNNKIVHGYDWGNWSSFDSSWDKIWMSQ